VHKVLLFKVRKEQQERRVLTVHKELLVLKEHKVLQVHKAYKERREP
jgi:hypothetical protein